MVSTRKFLGRLPEQRAMSFVLGGKGNRITHKGLKTRIGKRVILDANNATARNAAHAEKLEQAVREFDAFIARESARRQSPKILERIMRARKFQSLLRSLGEKKVTAFQLAAILAFQHGLEKEQLKPAIGPLDSLQVNHPKRVFWEGRMTQISQAVNKNLPARLEKLLVGTKRIMDSKEIARALALPWNKQTLTLVNTSMQLLDQMGIAEKHFPAASATGGPVATFSHKMHGALPVRHENAMLEILRAAHSRGQTGATAESLYKPKPFKGKLVGNPNARFIGSSIHRAAAKLKALGLLEIKKQHGGFSYFLSPEGKKLMDNFVRRGEKSYRPLNAYLLGEK